MAPPTLVVKNLPTCFECFESDIIVWNLRIISRLDAWRLDESIILDSSSHLQRVYIITTTANTRHLVR